MKRSRNSVSSEGDLGDQIKYQRIDSDSKDMVLPELQDYNMISRYIPESIWHNHIFTYMWKTFAPDELRKGIYGLRLTCKMLLETVTKSNNMWNPCLSYDNAINYLESALSSRWDISGSALTFRILVLDRVNMEIDVWKIKRLQSLMTQSLVSNLTLRFGTCTKEKTISRDAPALCSVIPFIPQTLRKLTIYIGMWTQPFKTLLPCLNSIKLDHEVCVLFRGLDKDELTYGVQYIKQHTNARIETLVTSRRDAYVKISDVFVYIPPENLCVVLPKDHHQPLKQQQSSGKLVSDPHQMFVETAIWRNHIFRHMKESYKKKELRIAVRSLRLACRGLHKMVLQSPVIWNPHFPVDNTLDYLENAINLGWDLSKSAMTLSNVTCDNLGTHMIYPMSVTCFGFYPSERIKELMSQALISEVTVAFLPEEQPSNDHGLKTLEWSILPFIPTHTSLRKLTVNVPYGEQFKHIFRDINQVTYDNGFHLCIGINHYRVSYCLKDVNASGIDSIPSYISNILLDFATPATPDLWIEANEGTIFRDTCLNMCSIFLKITDAHSPPTITITDDYTFMFTQTIRDWCHICEKWNPEETNVMTLYEHLIYSGCISLKSSDRDCTPIEVRVGTPNWWSSSDLLGNLTQMVRLPRSGKLPYRYRCFYYAKFVEHLPVQNGEYKFRLECIKSIRVTIHSSKSLYATFREEFCRGKHGAKVSARGKPDYFGHDETYDNIPFEKSVCYKKLESWTKDMYNDGYFMLLGYVSRQQPYEILRERPIKLVLSPSD